MIENLAGPILAGGTAMAGLILVFLGGVASAYDSYEAVDRNAVRSMYRRRAGFALAGFLASLFSAALAFLGQILQEEIWLWFAVVAVTVAFVITIILAVRLFTDIK